LQDTKLAGKLIASPAHYKYLTVTIAFLILTIVYSIYYSFGVFFKPVLDELGWSRAVTSGAFSLSWVVQGVFGVFMGWLNDKIGPRVVLSISGLLIGVGLLLTSQIYEVWQYYLYYGIIIGIGLSGVVGPLLSTVAKWFTKGRSVMVGIAATGVGVGIIIGPMAVNNLISKYNWRISYLILGSILLVLVVLISQWLKQPRLGSDMNKSADLKKEDYGLTFKEAVVTRQFWLVVVVFICLAFGVYTNMVHLVPHITDLGFSSGIAASAMAVMGIINVPGCTLLGGSADRIGVKRVYALGLFLIAGCYFWLTTIHDVPQLFAYVCVLGFATGGCCASQSIVISSLFGLRAHGTIFGVSILCFSLAAAGAPLLAGYIYDVKGSYNLAFIIVGIISLIGLVLTLMLKPLSQKEGVTVKVR
jgi:MFS family permease